PSLSLTRAAGLLFQRRPDGVADRRGRLARKLAQLALVVLELALARERAGARQHRRDRRREAGAFQRLRVFLLALVDVPHRLSGAAADLFGKFLHRPAVVAGELVDVAALAADQR